MASACKICADKLFVVARDISALPCGHTFHRTCLNRSWTAKKECPSCRKACKGKIDKLYFENFGEAIDGIKLKVEGLQTTVKARDRSQQAIERILKRKLTEASQELAKLKTTILEQEKEISILRTQNSTAAQELTQVAGKKTVTEDEVRRYRNVKSDLANRLGDVQAELRKSKEENDRLRAENVKQGQQLQLTEQKVAKVQSERQLKTERVAKANNQLKQQVNSTAVERATLQEELTKGNSQIKDLNRQMRDLQAKINTLNEHQVENDALRSKITEVHDQLLQSQTDHTKEMKTARDQHIKFTQKQREEFEVRQEALKIENEKLKFAINATEFSKLRHVSSSY